MISPQKASRRNPGGNQESSRETRRHPGGTQEAPRKHPGSTQEAPRSTQEAPRKHPGGTQEASRSPGSFRRHISHKSSPLSHQMQKAPRNGYFTKCSLKVRLRFTVNYKGKCSGAATTWRGTGRGPFTNTVRTPTAKDCLGNDGF